uniref:Ribosomal protein L32 n=1 Tax=Macaranga tanarius TaxID=109849 RepID=A0A886P907_9ROSI|nr:ribosomal protein L32 [Macaranga tanarius]
MLFGRQLPQFPKKALLYQKSVFLKIFGKGRDF